MQAMVDSLVGLVESNKKTSAAVSKSVEPAKPSKPALVETSDEAAAPALAPGHAKEVTPDQIIPMDDDFKEF
jgi:hypothetical protein